MISIQIWSILCTCLSGPTQVTKQRKERGWPSWPDWNHFRPSYFSLSPWPLSVSQCRGSPSMMQAWLGSLWLLNISSYVFVYCLPYSSRGWAWYIHVGNCGPPPMAVVYSEVLRTAIPGWRVDPGLAFCPLSFIFFFWAPAPSHYECSIPSMGIGSNVLAIFFSSRVQSYTVSTQEQLPSFSVFGDHCQAPEHWDEIGTGIVDGTWQSYLLVWGSDDNWMIPQRAYK